MPGESAHSTSFVSSAAVRVVRSPIAKSVTEVMPRLPNHEEGLATISIFESRTHSETV